MECATENGKIYAIVHIYRTMMNKGIVFRFNSVMLWLELQKVITGTTEMPLHSPVVTRASSPWPKEVQWMKLFKLVKFNKLSILLLEDYSILISKFKGLAAGTYCNLIDDCASSITVGADGKANVKINNYEEPILAVCTDCSSGGSVGTPGSTLPTTPLPTLGPGAKRTVIFIQKQTNPGQDLFVRGGIDGTVRPPCTDINSDCSIPFQVLT